MRYMHIHSMTLDQYLNDNQLKEAAFAELIGVDQSTINRLRKGQVPSKPIMEKIFHETGGVVRADDFFGLNDRARDAAA